MDKEQKVFSFEELEKICLEVMNIGMNLRQLQLNGVSIKSGKEILKEYLDKLKQNNC